ncbi:ribonuclease H-like domain-containing protein, partial [Tanacetum coccineum]
FKPKSFEEAAKHQPWIDAMNSEMDALYRNNDWDLVELPKGRKAIGSKWGIDFDETFSHVVKIVTVRSLINLVVQNGWTLYQMDVNNAFLYGDLNEIVYMSLPLGYFFKDETRIYELELAGSSSTSQNPQNVAFLSSSSTNSNCNSSTNKADNTAHGVSATHTQCNSTSRDNLSNAMICAFLASQPNSPQLVREDLEQIDPDLEEMDLQ